MTENSKRVELALTLKDIATAAGLSVAAVSKVINNREGVSQATRDRVLKIMDDLGYAGRAGKASANMPEQLSIVIPERYVTNDHFYGAIVRSVIDKCKELSIPAELCIVESQISDNGNPDIFRGSTPGAAILIGIDEEIYLDQVCAKNIAAVVLNGMDQCMRVSSVSPDYYYGAVMATRYLLDQGHREILHVTHPYRETFRLRIKGFSETLESYGISFDPKRHVLDLGRPNLLNISASEIIARELAERGVRPTAIFCATDMAAFGAMLAIQRIGLSVPHDISVIGFDGLALGEHSSPPLTTISIDRTEIAVEAVDMVLDVFKNNSVIAKRVALGVTLIERESTIAVPR